MQFIKIIFILVSSNLFAQNNLPDLKLKNNIDRKDDVQKILKLKNNEIAVSFFTNGGMMYQFDINNFIFKDNGEVIQNKEKIFYKRGKKHRRENIKISPEKKENLKEIIHSDLFKVFSKYTQSDFKYSANTHQICNKSFIDDAPENFVMITQKGRQNKIMVYLPKLNEKCSQKESPLMRFIQLHEVFDVILER